ncbi:Hypothetical protein PHPALM_37437, partial [Phytophthora palmivora]
KRRVEVQQRLMRMAAPSPSSLGLDKSYDRRPTARRPRPVPHYDPEEDALMSLIMEKEKREATSNQQIDRSMGLQPSKLPFPSVLPPLRRPEGLKPNSSINKVTLRPTGQKLNAAGDFYSPVRPRESSLNGSTSDFRQNLNISRIKAPTPKRFVRATTAPSPRNPFMYDQMKTPDRWRTTAMRSNQEEVNESALKRWEEEDARQADRLLEKAARDGDNDALWNDFFYGTKAARAKTNQSPEQPVVYSTSSFPEMFSRSRSNSHDGSCYEADDRPKSPISTGAEDLVAGDDKNFDNSSGDDRDQFSHGSGSAGAFQFVQVGALHGMEFPRWSMIVVVSCLVVGTSGFCMKELMTVLGLFSKRTPFTLSRGEQERMRDRVSLLQQELQGFQLSTSEIEVKAQTVLIELRQHMDRMRIDREKHQDMLATEMQELRHHILHVTHELVEKERKSFQAQLEEMVKIQVISEEEADTCASIAGVDAENEKKLEETPLEQSAQGELVVAPSQSSTLDVQVQVEQSTPAKEDDLVIIPSHDDFVNVQSKPTGFESQVEAHIDEVEHIQEAVLSTVSVLKQIDNKIGTATAPAAKVKVISKPPHRTSGMSLDGILLLVGIMFLAACVVLRVYNINRRKRWFEERRKRRNQRALLLAQQRARAMADNQEDSDDWEADDGVEEVSLMTPDRESENGEPKSEQQQSADIDTDLGDNNPSEQTSFSPAYRLATNEVRLREIVPLIS